MKKSETKQNNSGRRTLIIIAVSVVAVLAALIIAFLLTKNIITVKIAENEIADGEYKSAQNILEGNTSEDAEILSEYADLRIKINSDYAALLTDFDIEEIREWSNTAGEISSAESTIPDSIKNDINVLAEKLNLVCSLYDEYSEKYNDIMEMMDVFSEINRLYTKDESGKNTSFTVAEENEKISRWLSIEQEISDYAGRIPNGESIYLLTYLLKETQGECDDLKQAMNKVLDNGFSETDTVRVSGDGHKSFQSITNSDGVSVNLARKEEYADYLFSGICRALTESLAEYHTGF